MIASACGLLLGNIAYIIVLTTRGSKAKRREKYIKDKHQAIMKERTTALNVIKSAARLNRMVHEKLEPDVWCSNRKTFREEAAKVKDKTRAKLAGIIVSKYGLSKLEKK